MPGRSWVDKDSRGDHIWKERKYTIYIYVYIYIYIHTYIHNVIYVYIYIYMYIISYMYIYTTTKIFVMLNVYAHQWK